MNEIKYFLFAPSYSVENVTIEWPNDGVDTVVLPKSVIDTLLSKGYARQLVQDEIDELNASPLIPQIVEEEAEKEPEPATEKVESQTPPTNKAAEEAKAAKEAEEAKAAKAAKEAEETKAAKEAEEAKAAKEAKEAKEAEEKADKKKSAKK